MKRRGVRASPKREKGHGIEVLGAKVFAKEACVINDYSYKYPSIAHEYWFFRRLHKLYFFTIKIKSESRLS